LRVSLPADFSGSDIMVYFAGSPDGQIKGHDREAEKIAKRGRAFAVDRWRWEDMQSYMLLTILEVRMR
jgi:beta-1,2-xylosyltransferase